MGPIDSTNFDRNDQHIDRNMGYRRRFQDEDRPFSPDTHPNMQTRKDVRTVRDYPHRSGSLRSGNGENAPTKEVALSTIHKMRAIQLMLKNEATHCEKTAARKGSWRQKTYLTKIHIE